MVQVQVQRKCVKAPAARSSGRALHIFAIAFVLGCAFSHSLSTGSCTNHILATYSDAAAADDAATNQKVAPALTGNNPIANIEEEVTTCTPIKPGQTAALKSEIKDYEASRKFRDKVREVQDKQKPAAHHVAIEKYLREKVLQPGWSVLELGCATGMVLQMVQRAYTQLGYEHKELVGVELVTGWVKFAQSYHKEIKIFEGDITEFALPDPYAGKTFDFVMLNDVAEHIQKERYGCFFENLQRLTHKGSIVYMHTPTPQAQLADSSQYVENVLPHHVVVLGMALAGFELVTFEHDLDTVCSLENTFKDPSTPRALHDARCIYNKWPKYYHVLFRKSPKEVLVLS